MRKNLRLDLRAKKVGDRKYEFDEICDIIFDSFSHHIKVCVVKTIVETKDDNNAASLVNKIKLNMKKMA